MIKSLQTGLLLLTGIAGYLSYSLSCNSLSWNSLSWNSSATSWTELFQLTGSLFLAVSGSTVLNMWFDRDIDAKMRRTCNRPLPAGKVKSREAFILGLVLSILGVGWAFATGLIYGMVVFAGLFFDLIIYTIWLKRRTCWSIVWGGIAGAMPVLAGRSLATGEIDTIGILLSLAILFWIPTHTLTYSIHYASDYNAAEIPTFSNTYGTAVTQKIIAVSSMLASLAMASAIVWIGVTAGILRLVIVLSSGLLFLAITSLVRPSEKLNFGLFRYASVYMLSIMLVVVITGL